MNRWLLGLGIASLLIPGGSVHAQGHSAGVQVFGVPLIGVYKTGAGGHHTGYSGYSSPVYGYSAPMMGGCTGYSAFSSPVYGYSSPGFSAPSGCNGYSAFSSPTYSAPAYSAPMYGYNYPSAQAGILPALGGLVEAIRTFREIQAELDRMRPGGTGSSADVKALSDKLDKIEAKVNKIPDDVAARLTRIDQQVQEIPDIKKRLDRLEGKIPK